MITDRSFCVLKWMKLCIFSCCSECNFWTWICLRKAFCCHLHRESGKGAGDQSTWCAWIWGWFYRSWFFWSFTRAFLCTLSSIELRCGRWILRVWFLQISWCGNLFCWSRRFKGHLQRERECRGERVWGFWWLFMLNRWGQFWAINDFFYWAVCIRWHVIFKGWEGVFIRSRRDRDRVFLARGEFWVGACVRFVWPRGFKVRQWAKWYRLEHWDVFY